MKETKKTLLWKYFGVLVGVATICAAIKDLLVEKKKVHRNPTAEKPFFWTGPSGIKLEVYETSEHAAFRVADLLSEVVLEKPDAVLSLPTGSTPLPVYKELGRRVAANEISFERNQVFILDEYVGLNPSDPQSYRATIKREGTTLLGIPEAQVYGPEGESEAPDVAAKNYDNAIRNAGGIDFLLAGLGRNGHVAFNEPGTLFSERTHVVKLSQETRRDNGRFFVGTETPSHAITQGPETILSAQRIVLVVTGKNKADALVAALTQLPSTDCPASMLQYHRDVTVVADKQAAAKLLKKL